ncbi:MAG: hypothetical protein V7L21_26325 [Nostoc sp.]|uniref:hypothetical protein n=1 Tax=unclassified Nostoc TaxID=2593658 RepID=UPI0025D1A0F9|nr:hypothetical protein [Nostoc sp. NMS9]MBN3942997.1 hypothetical protein [Nostoc sp. NMS9]
MTTTVQQLIEKLQGLPAEAVIDLRNFYDEPLFIKTFQQESNVVKILIRDNS